MSLAFQQALGDVGDSADTLQDNLDVLGAIPVAGELFDAANAGISLGRGNWNRAGLSGLAVIPVAGNLATAGKVAGRLEIGLDAYGQMHHALSSKIVRALEKHKTLDGMFSRNDPKFIMRAANPMAHIGYQKWHRENDDEVVRWLLRHQETTPEKFESFLRGMYSTPEMRNRFPRGAGF